MSSGAAPFAILAWLGTVVLHGTLLMTLALALAGRVRSLWLRERILRVAFFGGFVTATLSSAGFEPLLGRIPLAPPEGEIADLVDRTEPAAGADLELASLAPGALPELARALEAGPVPASDPARSAGFVRDSAARAQALLTPVTASWLALGAFAAWCLLAWGRTALGFWRLGRKLRRRTPLQGPLASDLRVLRARARVRQPVRLSVCERASVPVTLGIFRREICLPRRALDAFTRTELRAILAHELAHTKRRDTVWFLAYALVERAFAFHPLQRKVRSELLATAELDCDDLAVGWTGSGLELASSLTEIARWLVAAGGKRLPVPTMAHDRSRLGRRVMRLLEPERPRARREQRALLGVGGCLALGGVCALAPALGAAARPARAPLASAPAPLTAAALAPEALDQASELSPAIEAADDATPLVAQERSAAGPAAPVALQLDQELLGSEMQLLGDELELLRGEVQLLDQPRLTQAMADIDRRLGLLAGRRQRMNELLERVFAGEPLDVGGAPRADVPPESP